MSASTKVCSHFSGLLKVFQSIFSLALESLLRSYDWFGKQTKPCTSYSLPCFSLGDAYHHEQFGNATQLLPGVE